MRRNRLASVIIGCAAALAASDVAMAQEGGMNPTTGGGPLPETRPPAAGAATQAAAATRAAGATPAVGSTQAAGATQPAAFVDLPLVGRAAAPDAPLALWYRTPAARWIEALPLGNGRLGAMAYGGVRRERFALNDSTFWSGSPDRHGPESASLMPELRRAVLADDYAAADALSRKLQGPFTEAYMPLAGLNLDAHADAAEAHDYRRWLDLDRAVHVTQYTIDGVTFTREAFVSAADDAMVVRITASRPGAVSLRATLDTQMRFPRVAAVDAGALELTGKAPLNALPSYVRKGPKTYADDVNGEGMTFAVRVAARAEGGTVRVDGDALRIDAADSVTLVLSAATSFNGFDRSPGTDGVDARKLAGDRLDAVASRSFDELLARHLAAHQPIFRRVSLDLGAATTAADPSDDRMATFDETRDPQLAALLFQYGRYLLMGSSRPGSPPANLQGIWNNSDNPPWSSNYTININTEMNYWPAETANLPETHLALIDFLRNTLSVKGAQTARRTFGARGWTAAHNTDLWGTSWPVGGGEGSPVWSAWPMGGAWLADHAWQRYAFDPDDAYLRDVAYPLMKGAAEFCLDLLVDDGHGRLVSVPSSSPEIEFKLPGGAKRAVTYAATMDAALMRELFKHCVEASQILGVDADFAAELKSASAKLVPYQVHEDGTLCEWADPRLVVVDPKHRHVSHLVGLYPLADVTPEMTAVRDAIRRTLDVRGDETTGWASVWRVALWARLGDGDRAYDILRKMMRPIEFGGRGSKGSGVYRNYFGSHPPFQIDGNFGFTTAVAEMLLQSHGDAVVLLPALPKAWPAGSVRGLRARGGFEVDVTWRDGAVTAATVRSKHGLPLKLRAGDATVDQQTVRGGTYHFGPGLRAQTPAAQ